MVRNAATSFKANAVVFVKRMAARRYKTLKFLYRNFALLLFGVFLSEKGDYYSGAVIWSMVVVGEATAAKYDLCNGAAFMNKPMIKAQLR